MRIREPAANGEGVLWVEYVRGGRVVDDYGVLEIASNLGQVLDVVALVVVTALPKEAVVNYLMDIELV